MFHRLYNKSKAADSGGPAHEGFDIFIQHGEDQVVIHDVRHGEYHLMALKNEVLDMVLESDRQHENQREINKDMVYVYYPYTYDSVSYLKKYILNDMDLEMIFSMK